MDTGFFLLIIFPLLFSFYTSDCVLYVICLLIDNNEHGKDVNSNNDDVEYKTPEKKEHCKFFLELVRKKGFWKGMIIELDLSLFDK